MVATFAVASRGWTKRVSAWRQSQSAPDGEEVSLTNDFLAVLHWVREMLGEGRAAVASAA
jgi:hypothetical protein